MLRTAGAAASAAALAGPFTARASAAPLPLDGPVEADFDWLLRVWRTLQLGTGFDPAVEPYASRLATLGADARGYLEAMAPAEGSLWPDAVYADDGSGSFALSAKITTGYTRLRTMAEAHLQEGTGLTGDSALLAGVLAGLDHLHADVYNTERATHYGNWWDWQIGSPMACMDVCVLLFEHLSGEQVDAACATVDHWIPDENFEEGKGLTGANRVDHCRSKLLRGAIGRSDHAVTIAAAALAPVYRLVTEDDGYYADGSFVQHHAIPYIGGYGASLTGGLALLLSLLSVSQWQAEDPGVFLDSVEGSIAPFIHNGVLMDNVSGRYVARGLRRDAEDRPPVDDHNSAHGLMASILLAADSGSPAQRVRWRAMVKGWMERDTHEPAQDNDRLPIARMALLDALWKDETVTGTPEPVGHRLFPSQARAVHRRRRWTASVSMASERIAHYEYGDTENPRGWHTGAGRLSWWGDDFGLDQYSDAYWPTVDPYRLPGTTVSTRRLADGLGGDWGNPCPPVSWVGGATDGEFAAVGQHLRGLGSTLSARKGWFFLDDGVVCLGAGISAQDGVPVETVLDNRALGVAGEAVLSVDGRAQELGWGTEVVREDVRWVHVPGHAGYVLLGREPAALHLLAEERTGAWSELGRNGSPREFTRRYLTLWHDHGTDPRRASYAHLLMPGASARAVSARAQADGGVAILANSPRAQGIRVPALGLTAVNFHEAGTVGPLSVNGPASVLVREGRAGSAVVCVADPTQGREELQVHWNEAVTAVAGAPDTLADSSTGDSLRLWFARLGPQAGRTQRVAVRTRR